MLVGQSTVVPQHGVSAVQSDNPWELQTGTFTATAPHELLILEAQPSQSGADTTALFAQLSLTPATTPSQTIASVGNTALSPNDTQHLAKTSNDAQAIWPRVPSKWWTYVKFPTYTGCMNTALLYQPTQGSPESAVQFINRNIPYASANTRRWAASDGHEAVMIVTTQKPPGDAPRVLGFAAFGASHEACLEAVSRGVTEYGED